MLFRDVHRPQAQFLLNPIPVEDWVVVEEDIEVGWTFGCCCCCNESESGQACVLQSKVSIYFPTQSFPPFCGKGLMQNRLRLNKPPSQLKEQLSNSTHSLQPPS
jgi:hypothetical protein